MATGRFVARIDSSTQSCKVVVVDPVTGHVEGEGYAQARAQVLESV